MTVVKYGCEAWAVQKTKEKLQEIFQRNCLRTVLRSLGHFLRIKNDRLPKILLIGQPARAKRKLSCLQFEDGECRKKRFKVNWNFLGESKDGVFE